MHGHAYLKVSEDRIRTLELELQVVMSQASWEQESDLGSFEKKTELLCHLSRTYY